jgi:hypothetical protein
MKHEMRGELVDLFNATREISVKGFNEKGMGTLLKGSSMVDLLEDFTLNRLKLCALFPKSMGSIDNWFSKTPHLFHCQTIPTTVAIRCHT